MKDFIKELKAANEKFQKEKKEGRCDFNIFEALKVEMKENYHSAFLAYLLDSNKGHYQTIFLEKFLERITLKTKLTHFKSKDCESITTESSTYQSRRIDILMKFSNGYHIIIENKISACDQEAQIRDYVESLHKQGVEAKQILVIYLTKYDTDPSDDSLCKYRCRKWEIKEHKILDSNNKTLKAYYLGISYKWIKEWLEKDCLKSIEKEGQKTIKGKTKAENGLNKLILCLRQYIEILDSHILESPNKQETKEYILDCVMQNAGFTNKALEILSKDKQDNKEQQECYEILKEHKNAIQDSILQDFYNAVECYCPVKIGRNIWYAENDKNKGILFYTKAEGLCLYFAIKSEKSACFTADAYGIKWLNTKKHKEALNDYFKKEAKKESFNAPYHYLKDHKTFQPECKNELKLCKWIYSYAQDKDTKKQVLNKAVKEFMPLFREFATKPLIKEYIDKYSKLFNDYAKTLEG